MKTGRLARPIERMMALKTKNEKLKTRPRNDTRMKPSAPSWTSGATPISRSSEGARKKPAAHSTSAEAITISRVCPATWPTILWFPAPTNCAIKVEPAIDRPAPRANIRNMTGNDSDTAATAAPPNRPTQKASMI
jgi:hypothetical protein